MRKRQGQAELDTGACAKSLNVATLPLFSSTQTTVGIKKPAFTLEQLRSRYNKKDRMTQLFLESNSVKVGNLVYTLAELKQRAQERRYAQCLNLTDTFNKLAVDKNLKMAFVTCTLKHGRFNPVNVLIVKDQSAKLRMLHTKLRDDRLFREPTENRMKRLGMTEPWYHISADDFQYIFTLEFQKDLTLHSHCAYFIPDDLEAYVSIYKAIIRKKDLLPEIGRVEFVLPYKFKDDFVRVFNLERFDRTKPDCFIETGTDIKGGDFIYLKFINDDSKQQKDYYTQTMRYITKYVMKGAGIKEDGTGNQRQRDEEILIRYNRLRMISFSRLLVPFMVYNRFYKELSQRKLSLYDLIKLKQQGRADYSVTIEDREHTRPLVKSFSNLHEYSEYVDSLFYDGIVSLGSTYEHDKMYIKCFEEGCFSPTLIFDELYIIPNQLEISLTIHDEMFSWKNKNSILCKTDQVTGEIFDYELSAIDFYSKIIGFEIDLDNNDVEFDIF